jgi:hypothetical protein
MVCQKGALNPCNCDCIKERLLFQHSQRHLKIPAGNTPQEEGKQQVVLAFISYFLVSNIGCVSSQNCTHKTKNIVSQKIERLCFLVYVMEQKKFKVKKS